MPVSRRSFSSLLLLLLVVLAARRAWSAPPLAPAAAATAPAPAEDLPSSDITVADAAAVGAAAAARDATLVRVLIALFNPWTSPEQRAEALKDPGLSEPRAAPAVAFLLGDPRREIRAAAAEALARYPGLPVVEEALIHTAILRQEAPEVRLAAVSALAQVGTAPAAEALLRLTEDDDQELALRNAARAALETRFPALAVGRGAAEVTDRGGRLLLTAGGAVLGSYGLGAVGGLGRNDAGTTIGILGGALVGAGTAFLLTRTGEITRAQAGWMISGGMWGAALGMLTAGIATADPSTRLTLSLGLLGEGAALGAAIATRRSMPYTGGDVAVIDLAGLTAVDLAGGALLMGQGHNMQLGKAVLVAGGLLGLGTGALLAPHLTFAGSDVALAADTAYEGLALGFLTGKAFDATDRRVGGASLLGLGAGVAGGVALAQITNYDTSDVMFVFVVGSYGKVLGLSIPMLADASDPALATGTLVGSVVSVGAAHLLRQKLEFKRGAVPFVALSTAVGFWHGLALGKADSSLSGRQQTGATLLGAAAGGLLAMPLVQVISPTSTEVLALAGGAFWGTWFAAWGAALANSEEPKMLRLTLAASDVGLATAALLVSPLCGVDSRRIGVANLGGLAGAGLASLAAALASKNNDTVITANLIGSGVGLVTGAVLAASLELSPLPARGEVTSSSVAPARAHPRGTGAIDFLLATVGTPQLVPLLLTGDARRAGTTSVGFALAFREAREPMVRSARY
ncbi:MAG: HEAT repeat domain-containing protein [Polyangia bacterium]